MLSFTYCITESRTKEEALANAKEAILCHIEGLRKAGERHRARNVLWNR